MARSSRTVPAFADQERVVDDQSGSHFWLSNILATSINIQKGSKVALEIRSPDIGPNHVFRATRPSISRLSQRKQSL